jgi:TonB-linked SusC/RagA family outer membrane protein
MKKNYDQWWSDHPYLKNLTMKLKITFVVIITCISNLFSSPSYSQLAKVSLDMRNSRLEQVMDEIEKQSEFYFIFNQKQIDIGRKVDIQAKNELITEVLPELFKGTDVTYTIFDRKILLTSEKSDKGTVVNNTLITAEQRQVRGKITDPNGTPLVGVNIVLKGTVTGATSDVAGNYSLPVNDGNGTLVFSFIGYTPKEVAIENRNVVDVVLTEELQALSEVVVTALGIKREVRTLGYATSDVKKEQISENRASTALGTLQGKVSGVNITTLTRGPQGANKIRIRGQSSFSGMNTPLIVVDGMPIDNTSYVSGGAVPSRGSGSVNNSDGGDGLSSINMDDVVSMTVLKGAAAAALYGSRAKDGVIMITTRQKGENKGFGVELNTNYTTDTPMDFTDFQYEYGQGEGGVRPTAPNPTSGVWSFGEKFEPGMTQILYDGVEVPYEPVYNRIRKFYETGTNLSNTITISNSSEKGGFSLSFSNVKNKSIVPNSDFGRNTINLGFDQNITKKLKASGFVNYSNEDNKNPAQVGGQEFSTASAVYTISNSMPWWLLKEKMLDANGDEFVYSRFLPRTNPYFSAYEHFENINRDRVFGNIALRYDINEWLYIQGRAAQDFYSRAQDYNIPNGYAAIAAAPVGYVKGSYWQESRRFRERNYDFLIGANHKFGDFGFDGTFGGNQMFRRMEYLNVAVQDFVQRGLYTVMNGRVKDPLYNLNERGVNSLYGSAEVSYKNYLYVNSTLRNDWFSTLAPGNRSILYPSVTASLVLTDAFKGTLPEWISFGKIRAAYAEVGDDNVSAYSDALYYDMENNSYPSPSGDLVPVGGINTTTIPNGNLRPMRVSESEIGLDLRLFNNAVSFDFAVYKKISKDQIISAQVSNTSGYNNQLINIGQSMNRGLESSISLSPINGKSFQWNVNANVTYNISEVQKLGLSEADTMISIGSVREIVGRPLGQIYVYMFLRDDQGRMIINKTSGYPMRSDLVNVGCNQPNWYGGITNSFTFKGITISALIDFKLGKDYIINGGANYNYWRHGLHKGTLPGRDVGYVIADGVNPDGQVNTTKAAIQPYYESITGNVIDEPFLYKGGFWKLRQINLSYDFTSLIPKTFFVKGLRVSVVSNNVATLKKWTENMDPEELYSFSDNSNGRGWSSLPLTRSLGFNVNVKF